MEICFLCRDEWCLLPHQSPSILVVVVVFVCFFSFSKRPEDWEESIFVRHKECGYRLRDNVHFHMYISTSPCGDGRLNSPYEISADRKTPPPFDPQRLRSLTLYR